MRVVWTLAAIAAALSTGAGCGDDRPLREIDLSCEGMPDPHCDHPIDRLLVPALRELGSGPRDAAADELCRRMALDLAGRTPTPEERAACQTQTPAEMADVYMADPGFTRTARQAWAELAKYESLLVWSADLVDLDDTVGRLYAGELGYADFVRAFALHPAFYGLHPDDSWTANLFAIFLGRPARQDELDAARPLLQLWAAQVFAGREVFWNYYQTALGNSQAEAAATTFGNTLSYNAAKFSWGVNLCRCTPSLLSAGCVSDVFGPTLRIAPRCVAPDPFDAANLARLSPRTPSDDDLCPDGVTRRDECRDRRRGLDPVTFAPLDVWPELDAAGHAELAQIGDALVARADLWEAAVDRELRRLLGWWQATFKHPDSDLPAVRALLAERLRDGGSIREVVRLIVTSQLYVQPAAIPAGLDGDALPPWAAGPAKLLAGDRWLRAAAAAVGESAGTCDFRFGQASEYEPRWADPRLVDATVGTIDDVLPAGPRFPYSVGATQRLGGCTGDARRAELSDVGLAFSQAAIARELCAIGSEVTPPGWDGQLASAATFLVERVLARAAAPTEVATLTDEMSACVAAGASGCGDAEIAARWLCVRLLDSAQFATY
ncbi:MAG: DUF1549 domain-containing protein [Kofleriaceae bacterium]